MPDRRRVLGALAAAVFAPGIARAQGFAGLGTHADGYAAVVPDVPLAFPRDHGPHPDFRIEWWYVTANLTDDDGADYGVQFTLFRQAARPPPQTTGWDSQQFWLGHAAVTSADAHLYAERLVRGGIGHGGAVAAPFSAWVDDWAFESVRPDQPGWAPLSLRAHGEGFAYDLTLATEADPVPQGVGGYSRKSDRGQASYYFSQPYFAASGTLTLGGRTLSVTGRAWMDREWSSQPLAEDQSGWDWFSLHLSGGAKMMAFRLRQDDGSHYLSGNWIEAGRSTPIPGEGLSLTPVAETDLGDRILPTTWTVRVPDRGVDVTVTPLNPRAWNGTDIGYWEGPVFVAGSHDGIGYLEMTGY